MDRGAKGGADSPGQAPLPDGSRHPSGEPGAGGGRCCGAPHRLDELRDSPLLPPVAWTPGLAPDAPQPASAQLSEAGPVRTGIQNRVNRRISREVCPCDERSAAAARSAGRATRGSSATSRWPWSTGRLPWKGSRPRRRWRRCGRRWGATASWCGSTRPGRWRWGAPERLPGVLARGARTQRFHGTMPGPGAIAERRVGRPVQVEGAPPSGRVRPPARWGSESAPFARNPEARYCGAPGEAAEPSGRRPPARPWGPAASGGPSQRSMGVDCPPDQRTLRSPPSPQETV